MSNTPPLQYDSILQHLGLQHIVSTQLATSHQPACQEVPFSIQRAVSAPFSLTAAQTPVSSESWRAPSFPPASPLLTPSIFLPQTNSLELPTLPEERPFSCDYCGHRSKSKSDLNMHTKLHTDTDQEKKARRVILNERKRAYEERNIREGRFSCDSCTFNAPNRGRLVEHVRSHTGERPFTCDICDFTSKTSKGLSDHSKKHGEKPLHCNECDYRTNRKADLDHHLKKHTGELHNCTQCDFKTTRDDQLREHIANKHCAERPFSCDQCEHKSATQRSLNQHLKKHNNKTFSCSQCEYQTKWSSCLTKHLRKHTGEKPFSCNQCEYTARIGQELKSHVARVHAGEKAFSCPHCEYKATRKYDVTQHVTRMHTSEKAFSCEHCEYRATRKNDITVHARRVHPVTVKFPFQGSGSDCDSIVSPPSFVSKPKYKLRSLKSETETI